MSEKNLIHLRYSVMGVLVFALLLTAGWRWMGNPFANGPEDVVTAYLADVRAGDVEAALAHTGWTPHKKAATFLTPEAIDADWSVDGVVEIEREAGRARVEVTASGDGVESVDGVFDLIADGDSWRLDMPFAEVGFGRLGLGHVMINGQRDVPAGHPMNQRYLLFPGLYHFYGTDNPSIEVDIAPRLLLPGSGTTWIDGDMAVTDAGAASAQAAVNSYVDACVADYTGTRSCPFGLDVRTLDELLDVERHSVSGTIEWELEEYPVIEVEYVDGRFEIRDVETGAVELTGTMVERVRDEATREYHDGAAFDFAVDCRIEARWLTAVVDAEGEWTIGHLAEVDDDLDWRPAPATETCGARAAY